MIPIRIKSGPFKGQTGNLVTRWEEVSTAQKIKLGQEGELKSYELLSILSGIDAGFWMNESESSLADWLSKTTALAKPVQWFELPIELNVMIGDKLVSFPDSVADAPAGAVEAIRTIAKLEESKKTPNMESIIPMTLALLAVKPYFGVFDKNGEERAAELLPLINELPAMTTFPLANFFLRIWKRDADFGTSVSALSLMRNTFRQALKSSISSEAS